MNEFSPSQSLLQVFWSGEDRSKDSSHAGQRGGVGECQGERVSPWWTRGCGDYSCFTYEVPNNINFRMENAMSLVSKFVW